MVDSVFSGLRGNLHIYVAREVAKLSRSNNVLQRSRYSWGATADASTRRRSLNWSVVPLLLIFSVFLGLSVWLDYRFAPALVPRYPATLNVGFLKDVASYLIASQIGILAIVAVAVGVATLLSERDDGASINTDVRLYYFESYSYELAVGGVALLLVLIVQLFWPPQHLLHLLP